MGGNDVLVADIRFARALQVNDASLRVQSRAL